MNDETRPADESSDPLPFDPMVAPPVNPPRTNPIADWLKKLLVCNPFFLASAALLLYGMYRISMDAVFLPTETGQLVFNFTSIQTYELALVITAALLAHRRIWYDATLLVVLENLFILVPFILISHAALIEQSVVLKLCLFAVAVATIRTEALRRRVSELWPAPGLFSIGTLVLAANCALPIIYRHLHETKYGTKLEEGPAYHTNLYVWLIGLPLLCALAMFLPRPLNDNHPLRQRQWFPQALLAFWLLGTGAHLYCLGYVYDFDLKPHMLAPSLWMLAWISYFKLSDFVPVAMQCKMWRNVALLFPLPMAFISADAGGSYVFLVLTLLNVAAFARIAFDERENKLALQLAMVSLAALIAGIPVERLMPYFAGFDQAKLIGMSAMVYVLIATAMSRNPKLGLLGAFAAAVGGAMLKPEADTFDWAAQSGMVFFLIHSLRWQDHEHEGVALVRWTVALAWFAQTIFWVRDGAEVLHPIFMGASVLIFWGVHWFIKQNRVTIAIPLAALLVMLTSPANLAFGKLSTTPAGVLAIAGSFVLFAAGTIAALTRHRWHRN